MVLEENHTRANRLQYTMRSENVKRRNVVSGLGLIRPFLQMFDLLVVPPY
jgi:hypothetical protein